MSYSQHFLLSNGLPIPAVGFGTWHIPEEAAEAAVRDAIQTGYRLVDTAAVYRNEAGTGRGILSSGVPREELFITSKLWNTERSYDKAMRAFDKTMERLQLSYLDLYLIHWPANGREYEDWDAVNRETWRAMIDLYKSGRVRSIGVSNFRPHHLTSLLESEVPPMVNQIKYHPGFMQQDVVTFCQDNGIVVEAWSPLGHGESLQEPVLQQIAARHGCTAAQAALRWCCQHGVLALPKSVHPERMAANLQFDGFALTDAEMAAIDALDTGDFVDSDNKVF